MTMLCMLKPNKSGQSQEDKEEPPILLIFPIFNNLTVRSCEAQKSATDIRAAKRWVSALLYNKSLLFRHLIKAFVFCTPKMAFQKNMVG